MSTLNSNEHLQTESTTISSLTIGLVIASSLLGILLLLFCIYYFKKRNQTINTNEEEIKKNHLRKGWSFSIFKRNDKKKKSMILTTILDDIPLPKPTLLKSSIHNNKSSLYYSTMNHQSPLSSSTIYSMDTSTITPSYYEEEGYDPKILYQYNQSSTLSLKKKENHHHQQYHPNLIHDYIKDPTILQSLERQKHENDFYYKGTVSSNMYRYDHSTMSSTSVLSHHPSNNDSSLNHILLSSFISLPPTSSNDLDHQEKSSTYHVW